MAAVRTIGTQGYRESRPNHIEVALSYWRDVHLITTRFIVPRGKAYGTHGFPPWPFNHGSCLFQEVEALDSSMRKVLLFSVGALKVQILRLGAGIVEFQGASSCGRRGH